MKKEARVSSKKNNKQFTAKRSDKLRSVVNYGFARVAEWTQNELDQLRASSKMPVCIPMQNGDYLVGTRRVIKVTLTCWQVENIEFSDKRAAIFYCAMIHLGKYADAEEIRKLDYQTSKLDSDKTLFRTKLDNAHISNDQFRIDLFSSRYEDAKSKLHLAKQELSKSLVRYKYIYE